MEILYCLSYVYLYVYIYIYIYAICPRSVKTNKKWRWIPAGNVDKLCHDKRRAANRYREIPDYSML